MAECMKCRHGSVCEGFQGEHSKDCEFFLPESGWISVKERLPEDNAYYLVWRKGWQIPSIMKCRRKAGFNTHMAYGDVTHWMPLPEPPGEEGNDG